VAGHRLPKYVPSDKELPPVSVVICARNEEKNLENFLPLVLEQKYPNFEVVVVDDCSADDTDMVLRRLSAKYKNLKTTVIKPDLKFNHGKKLALTVGIKAATHSWLLLTDADCRPDSEFWLMEMAKNFHSNNQVVLGYGGYLSGKGLLNKMIRFDTFHIALQYLGFALMGIPYMGVGRNLAYRKELFFKNKGFASHNHIASGDDDLFVQQVASKMNTAVEFSHKAHTRSVASATFKEWVKQKRRHLTTSPKYRKGIKFWLGFEPFSRMLFWSAGIMLLINQNYLIIVVGLLLLRLLVTSIIIKIAMNRLNEKKIFLLSLVYDLFSPIFTGALLLANRLTQKPRKWN
jgi:glycosyltransferase involved in cell wall biosynthesis